MTINLIYFILYIVVAFDICIVAVLHRHSPKSRPKILDYHKSRILIDKYLYFLKKIYTLNYSIPKPSKTLSKKRSGMANARKTRCGRQRSPSPLSSPIPESNYLTSAPTTPPDSSFATPAPTPAPELAFGDEPSHRVSTETTITEPPFPKSCNSIFH